MRIDEHCRKRCEVVVRWEHVMFLLPDENDDDGYGPSQYTVYDCYDDGPGADPEDRFMNQAVAIFHNNAAGRSAAVAFGVGRARLLGIKCRISWSE